MLKIRELTRVFPKKTRTRIQARNGKTQMPKYAIEYSKDNSTAENHVPVCLQVIRVYINQIETPLAKCIWNRDHRRWSTFLFHELPPL